MAEFDQSDAHIIAAALFQHTQNQKANQTGC